MATKEEGVFVTQKGNRRGGQAEDAVDADQLEEMVAGVAQTSQSTLLLKKKKEMREVCWCSLSRAALWFYVQLLTTAVPTMSKQERCWYAM